MKKVQYCMKKLRKNTLFYKTLQIQFKKLSLGYILLCSQKLKSALGHLEAKTSKSEQICSGSYNLPNYCKIDI